MQVETWTAQLTREPWCTLGPCCSLVAWKFLCFFVEIDHTVGFGFWNMRGFWNSRSRGKQSLTLIPIREVNSSIQTMMRMSSSAACFARQCKWKFHQITNHANNSAGVQIDHSTTTFLNNMHMLLWKADTTNGWKVLLLAPENWKLLLSKVVCNLQR